jgi:hypothetical protein
MTIKTSLVVIVAAAASATILGHAANAAGYDRDSQRTWSGSGRSQTTATQPYRGNTATPNSGSPRATTNTYPPRGPVQAQQHGDRDDDDDRGYRPHRGNEHVASGGHWDDDDHNFRRHHRRHRSWYRRWW